MRRAVLGAAVLCALLPNSGVAGEKEELFELRRAVVELVEKLVEQGALPRDKADAIVQKAMERAPAEPEAPADSEAPAAEAAPAPEPAPGTVRVPYIPEPVREAIREEIKDEIRKEVVEDVIARGRAQRWGIPESWPLWMQRMRWSGDFRLRAQTDDFADDNATLFYRDIQKSNDKREDILLNTTEDRERLRLRLRLGVDIDIHQDLLLGARIATGSTGDPVSTNQTLGNANRPGQLVLDRAFLRYQNLFKSWTLWGGRMPNPWLGTDLVWDKDLNFDGVAVTYRPRAAGDWAKPFDPFLTVGAFPLQEIELSKDDKWLYGAQLGFRWRIAERHRVSFGLGYYDYQNIVGRANEFGSDLLDFTAPPFVQKGNTMFLINDPDPAKADRVLWGLASEFREANATAVIDFTLGDDVNHLIFTMDYVKNVGFDREEILQRTGGAVYVGPLKDDDSAYQYKLAVGRPAMKFRGDWQVYAAYKHIERDAVLDAFTDSDFHLGGTDAKGWIAGGTYALAENTWLNVRYLSTNEISGPPLGIDTLQIDLNVRF